jgi:Na+-transporting NADH:ubiquinone oxidoreductase subunit B
MIVVVVALIPALLMGMYNIGYQAGIEGILPAFWFGFLKMLPMIIVSYVTGLAIEFAFAQKRKHEINEGFLVSGLLIPMVMPITVPLWIVALSTAFAVIIGKEVFGGTGMNVFNPALLARAFAFFAYTPQMSGEAVWYADSKTGATALEQLASTGDMQWSLMDAFLGFIPGSVGEVSTLAILIGAAILLITRVASWKTMISVFAGGAFTAFLFNQFGPDTAIANLPWYMHLVLGGFAFGAVFMATDPVTSARTECGKWIYGFLIGVIAIVVRVLNPGYPEGMMLAILLMNIFANLIDYYVVQANINKRLKRAK